MKVTHIGRHAMGDLIAWTDTGNTARWWSCERGWSWSVPCACEVPDDIDLDAIKVGPMLAIDDAPRKPKAEPIVRPWVVMMPDGYDFAYANEARARDVAAENRGSVLIYLDRENRGSVLIYLDRENPRVVPAVNSFDLLMLAAGLTPVDTDKLTAVEKAAGKLAVALEDMAKDRAAEDHGGYPGPADIDDLASTARHLEALIDGLSE